MKNIIKSLFKILLLTSLIIILFLVFLYYKDKEAFDFVIHYPLINSNTHSKIEDEEFPHQEADNEEIAPPLNANSSELKTTSIAPALECKIDEHKNLIYCSTFQMTWNSLYSDLIKETIEISSPPDYLEFINNHIKEKPCVSEDSYISMAGFIKEKIEKKINDKLANRFNESLSKLNISFDNLNPDDIVAFSYLFKKLNFKSKFEKTNIYNFNNLNSNIKGVGIKFYLGSVSNKLKNQLKILYCKSRHNSLPNGFIIKLITDSDSDEIIISTLKPEKDLLKSYEKIDDFINRRYDKYLTNKDSNVIPKDYEDFWGHGSSLAIPKINFKILHSFNELVNNYFKNKNFNQYKISQALQFIFFNLDEQGVILKSYSMLLSSGASLEGPKNFIVDCPFIIYLKNQSSTYPYFMAYICNDELLVKNSNNDTD